MQIREITEAWFDTLDKFKQLKSTQDLRKTVPTYSAGPSTRPAGVLPDPGMVLLVTLPNGGRYFKDFRGTWWNELNQQVQSEQTDILERMLAMDKYTQVQEPRAGMSPKPAVRRVSRRRGMPR